MSSGKRVALALAAVAVTAATLWLTSRAVAPRQATWDDVAAEARDGGYGLITTQELKELWAREPGRLLVVDTRQDWEHRSGHIQGSTSFPMEPTAFSRWHRQAALAELLGPDKDRPVVFY